MTIHFIDEAKVQNVCHIMLYRLAGALNFVQRVQSTNVLLTVDRTKKTIVTCS